MPYIPSQERQHMERWLDMLADEIRTPGQLNYAISRLLSLALDRMTRPDGIGYHDLSRWRAAVNDASDEFYHRVIRPYEDMKRAQNGDVYHELKGLDVHHE